MKTFNKIKWLIISPVFLPFITTAQAPGQNVPSPGLAEPFKILRYNTIGEFINAILQLLVQIGLPLIVLAIIYSGFLFVAARGNEGQLEKAKETLKWTIIGAAIILGAFVISQVIQGTVNSITG